ncbi:unnamed protein product, partial [Porites evermanni]
MSIGVPIKILHEAEGHIVTLETMTGEVYRGKLVEAEDNMNCQMSNTTVTARDGRVSQLEQVFIRGSKIRFLILPDMLKNAPMFKKMTQKGSGGSGAAGRGKSAILRAQGIILSLSVDSSLCSFLVLFLQPLQEEEAHQLVAAEEPMFSKEEDS